VSVTAFLFPSATVRRFFPVQVLDALQSLRKPIIFVNRTNFLRKNTESQMRLVSIEVKAVSFVLTAWQ
jgi:hypothetical protein